MIYPRLKLARNLLRDDGVIFISIDDNEQANLKRLCDEVFGEDNFLAGLVWRTDGNFDNQAKFKNCHEHIIVYGRSEEFFPAPPVIDPSTPKNSKLFKAEIRNTIVKNGYKNPVSNITLPIGFPAEINEGVIIKRENCYPHYREDAIISNGKLTNVTVISSGWSSKDLLNEFIENQCKPIIDAKGQETRFLISKTGAIEVIKTRSDYQSHVISSITGFGGSQKATQELTELGVLFDSYPKPVDLIKYFAKMNFDDGETIILDFFSGSATTAHAVMQLNAEDGGKRKFIMVQLPEQCDEKSEAFKAGYKTIAEIGKERIRRAGQKIKSDNPLTTQYLDIGFRVFKTDTSNMADVFYSPDAVDKNDLLSLVDNIKPDRTAEDLLFQLMLDWGVELALPIAKKTIHGKEVFLVDGNALVACFDAHGGVDEEFVKELAKIQPLRVVFRDAGFKDSAVKINVEQIFKLLSPETDVKCI